MQFRHTFNFPFRFQLILFCVSCAPIWNVLRALSTVHTRLFAIFCVSVFGLYRRRCRRCRFHFIYDWERGIKFDVVDHSVVLYGRSFVVVKLFHYFITTQCITVRRALSVPLYAARFVSHSAKSHNFLSLSFCRAPVFVDLFPLRRFCSPFCTKSQPQSKHKNRFVPLEKRTFAGQRIIQIWHLEFFRKLHRKLQCNSASDRV